MLAKNSSRKQGAASSPSGRPSTTPEFYNQTNNSPAAASPTSSKGVGNNRSLGMKILGPEHAKKGPELKYVHDTSIPEERPAGVNETRFGQELDDHGRRPFEKWTSRSLPVLDFEHVDVEDDPLDINMLVSDSNLVPILEVLSEEFVSHADLKVGGTQLRQKRIVKRAMKRAINAVEDNLENGDDDSDNISETDSYLAHGEDFGSALGGWDPVRVGFIRAVVDIVKDQLGDISELMLENAKKVAEEELLKLMEQVEEGDTSPLTSPTTGKTYNPNNQAAVMAGSGVFTRGNSFQRDTGGGGLSPDPEDDFKTRARAKLVAFKDMLSQGGRKVSSLNNSRNSSIRKHKSGKDMPTGLDSPTNRRKSKGSRSSSRHRTNPNDPALLLSQAEVSDSIREMLANKQSIIEAMERKQTETTDKVTQLRQAIRDSKQQEVHVSRQELEELIKKNHDLTETNNYLYNRVFAVDAQHAKKSSQNRTLRPGTIEQIPHMLRVQKNYRKVLLKNEKRMMAMYDYDSGNPALLGGRSRTGGGGLNVAVIAPERQIFETAKRRLDEEILGIEALPAPGEDMSEMEKEIFEQKVLAQEHKRREKRERMVQASTTSLVEKLSKATMERFDRLTATMKAVEEKQVEVTKSSQELQNKEESMLMVNEGLEKQHQSMKALKAQISDQRNSLLTTVKETLFNPEAQDTLALHQAIVAREMAQEAAFEEARAQKEGSSIKGGASGEGDSEHSLASQQATGNWNILKQNLPSSQKVKTKEEVAAEKERRQKEYAAAKERKQKLAEEYAGGGGCVTPPMNTPTQRGLAGSPGQSPFNQPWNDIRDTRRARNLYKPEMRDVEIQTEVRYPDSPCSSSAGSERSTPRGATALGDGTFVDSSGGPLTPSRSAKANATRKTGTKLPLAGGQQRKRGTSMKSDSTPITPKSGTPKSGAAKVNTPGSTPTAKAAAAQRRLSPEVSQPHTLTLAIDDRSTRGAGGRNAEESADQSYPVNRRATEVFTPSSPTQPPPAQAVDDQDHFHDAISGAFGAPGLGGDDDEARAQLIRTLAENATGSGGHHGAGVGGKHGAGGTHTLAALGLVTPSKGRAMTTQPGTRSGAAAAAAVGAASHSKMSPGTNGMSDACFGCGHPLHCLHCKAATGPILCREQVDHMVKASIASGEAKEALAEGQRKASSRIAAADASLLKMNTESPKVPGTSGSLQQMFQRASAMKAYWQQKRDQLKAESHAIAKELHVRLVFSLYRQSHLLKVQEPHLRQLLEDAQRKVAVEEEERRLKEEPSEQEDRVEAPPPLLDYRQLTASVNKGNTPGKGASTGHQGHNRRAIGTAPQGKISATPGGAGGPSTPMQPVLGVGFATLPPLSAGGPGMSSGGPGSNFPIPTTHAGYHSGGPGAVVYSDEEEDGDFGGGYAEDDEELLPPTMRQHFSYTSPTPGAGGGGNRKSLNRKNQDDHHDEESVTNATASSPSKYLPPRPSTVLSVPVGDDFHVPLNQRANTPGVLPTRTLMPQGRIARTPALAPPASVTGPTNNGSDGQPSWWSHATPSPEPSSLTKLHHQFKLRHPEGDTHLLPTTHEDEEDGNKQPQSGENKGSTPPPTLWPPETPGGHPLPTSAIAPPKGALKAPASSNKKKKREDKSASPPPLWPPETPGDHPLPTSALKAPGSAAATPSAKKMSSKSTTVLKQDSISPWQLEDGPPRPAEIAHNEPQRKSRSTVKISTSSTHIKIEGSQEDRLEHQRQLSAEHELLSSSGQRSSSASSFNSGESGEEQGKAWTSTPKRKSTPQLTGHLARAVTPTNTAKRSVYTSAQGAAAKEKESKNLRSNDPKLSSGSVLLSSERSSLMVSGLTTDRDHKAALQFARRFTVKIGGKSIQKEGNLHSVSRAK